MRKLVQSQTSARLRRLDREIRQVARKPKDADAIHDLRVAIRRLSQELKIFGEWFEPKRVKSIRVSLKQLMDRCAAVRNCDIAAEVLRSAGCRNSELFAGLEKERRHRREELAGELVRWRPRDRARKWREHLRVQAGGDAKLRGDAAENARRLLPAMMDQLFRAGRNAARLDSSRRRMHRFRLETKRVRYTLELFEPVYGRKTNQILAALKGLQEKLGAINDCATTLEMIRRDRDAAAAVRRLSGRREEEFREHWKKHFGARERIRWKAVLDAADGKQ